MERLHERLHIPCVSSFDVFLLMLCSAVPREFLGILLVTYLVNPEVPPWWAVTGEKNLKWCPSRTLENAFPTMLSIAFCNGEREEKQNVG